MEIKIINELADVVALQVTAAKVSGRYKKEFQASIVIACLTLPIVTWFVIDDIYRYSIYTSALIISYVLYQRWKFPQSYFRQMKRMVEKSGFEEPQTYKYTFSESNLSSLHKTKRLDYPIASFTGLIETKTHLELFFGAKGIVLFPFVQMSEDEIAYTREWCQAASPENAIQSDKLENKK